jgi:ABC-type phosphate/phosphonate transport system permease subunit
MASYAIRKAWFGFPAGGKSGSAPVASGAATNAAAVVTIPFNEVLRTSTQPTLSQFTATVAAVGRAVNTVVAAGKTLTVTLASAPTAGQPVVVTYTQGVAGAGRLADVDGQEVPSSVIASFNAT